MCFQMQLVPLRLGITSLYALLGAAAPSRDAFTPIDCKNIQMDTMVGRCKLNPVDQELESAWFQTLSP
jgi:hypothetical protein